MSGISEGPPVVEGAYEASDAHLKQQISLFGLIALAVSVQVGSGWLLATLAAASIAGPASILTWVLGAVFFGIIGVTWMELGAMLPRSGAGVRYPRLTHGAFLSWFNGWGYLIAALSLPVIEVQAVLTYIGGNWPGLGLLEVREGITVLSWPTGILVGFILLFVFFLLNSFGAKLLSESNKYVTIWKLVIPIVTALLMFAAFSSANFTIGGGFAPLGGGAVFGALASGGIVFAYSGLRQILDFGGEVVNPQRNIPIAIVVGGLIIPLVIYILLQIGFIGAIDWAAAGVQPGDWAGLQDSPWASAPLLNAVAAAGFAWFAIVLLSDAALSPAATGWVWLGIGTRTVYSFTWLSLGSNGRREAVLSSDMDAAAAFADGMSADEIARYRPAFAEITDVLVGAGLKHDSHGVSPVNPEFARMHHQWEAAARAWLSGPAEGDAVIMTCLLVDGRPIHGDLALPEVARVFGDLRLHPSTMKMLLVISVDRSDALRGRWRRKEVDLKRRALLPIANIARWAALSAGSSTLQTPDRLQAAAGSRMLTAEDADTLGDVFEIVQRMRLRHQLEQLEAGETPSDTIRLRDMSTIDASVLNDAIREILAVQRRMANKAKYVPDLEGLPVA